MSSGGMLRLPTEPRLRIFKEVLGGPIVRYGWSEASDASLVESINALSIINHTFLDEVKDCLSHVAFQFCDSEKLLHFFIRTLRDLHTSIRDVRVEAIHLTTNPQAEAGLITTYELGYVIQLISGLQLDRLTVDAYESDEGDSPWIGKGPYLCCQGLIRGKGWKELHFISPNAQFLQWSSSDAPAFPSDYFDLFGRKPQPDGWNKMLPKRDGPQSDASVQMYREKAIGSGTQDPENCEAVFQPNLSSIELVDTRSDEEVLAGIGFSQDERRSPTGHAQPDSAERAEREHRIVARRGASVDYTETGESKRLWEVMGKYGWKGVKVHGRPILPLRVDNGIEISYPKKNITEDDLE